MPANVIGQTLHTTNHSLLEHTEEQKTLTFRESKKSSRVAENVDLIQQPPTPLMKRQTPNIIE
jgi:hypothetical protein